MVQQELQVPSSALRPSARHVLLVEGSRLSLFWVRALMPRVAITQQRLRQPDNPDTIPDSWALKLPNIGTEPQSLEAFPRSPSNGSAWDLTQRMGSSGALGV